MICAYFSFFWKISLLYWQVVKIYPSLLAYPMSPRIHTMFSSKTAQGILLCWFFITCYTFYAFLLQHVGFLHSVSTGSFMHSWLIRFKYCFHPLNYWLKFFLPKSNCILFDFTSPHVQPHTSYFFSHCSRILTHVLFTHVPLSSYYI